MLLVIIVLMFDKCIWMVEVGGREKGRREKTCFYKLLNFFPIIARPRNNGHKFYFFLCSSPSLPSYLIMLQREPSSWSEQPDELSRVVPARFPSTAHVRNATSEMLTSEIRISTLGNGGPFQKELLGESDGKWNLQRDDGIIEGAP